MHGFLLYDQIINTSSHIHASLPNWKLFSQLTIAGVVCLFGGHDRPTSSFEQHGSRIDLIKVFNFFCL